MDKCSGIVSVSWHISMRTDRETSNALNDPSVARTCEVPHMLRSHRQLPSLSNGTGCLLSIQLYLLVYMYACIHALRDLLYFGVGVVRFVESLRPVKIMLGLSAEFGWLTRRIFFRSPI